MKDNDGNTVQRTEAKLNRWKEQFISDFADDLDLLSTSHQQIQEKLTKFPATSLEVSLNIHKDKIKILKINTAREDLVLLHGIKL